MRALDVGHRSSMEIEPLLAKDAVPAPANQLVDHNKDPDGKMIYLRVHKSLRIIRASEVRLQVDSYTRRGLGVL